MCLKSNRARSDIQDNTIWGKILHSELKSFNNNSMNHKIKSLVSSQGCRKYPIVSPEENEVL